MAERRATTLLVSLSVVNEVEVRSSVQSFLYCIADVPGLSTDQ